MQVEVAALSGGPLRCLGIQCSQGSSSISLAAMLVYFPIQTGSLLCEFTQEASLLEASYHREVVSH
jgi:hypothetical protein